MKHIFLLFGLLLTVQSVNAQYYYYNKGEKYLDMGWNDLAFSEYVDGMNAGEPSSAMMVAWCYLKEKGTPRNVQKAVSILKQWSKKDMTVCLFTAIFFDPAKCAANVGWNDDILFNKKVAGVSGASVGIYGGGIHTIYGRKPLFAEDYGISPNIDEAIRYAEILNTRVNSVSTKDFLELLKLKKIEESGDMIALLSAQRSDNTLDRSGITYRRVLSSALEQCSSLEEISAINNIDYSKQAVLKNAEEIICNNQYLMYESDIFNVLANTSLVLYKSLLSDLGGKNEVVLDYYNNNPKIRQALDVGLSAAAYYKGWKDNDIKELEWLCDNVPFNYSNNNARATWTRLMLKKYILEHASWPLFSRLFSSSYYIELEGTNPVPNEYFTKYYNYVRAKERKSSDYFELLDAERELWKLETAMKDNNWRKISTQKKHFYAIREHWFDAQYDLLDNNDKINGVPYNQVLDKYAKMETTIDKNILGIIHKQLNEDVTFMDIDLKDSETYTTQRGSRSKMLEFVEFLLKEQKNRLSINDYVVFQNSSTNYGIYAKNRLTIFKQSRIAQEADINNRTGFSPQLKKEHDMFRSLCISGKRKKLTPENVSHIKTDVLIPTLEKCKKAYETYTLDSISEIQKNYEEEIAVADIIMKYFSDNDALGLSESFLKQHPSSKYLPLITDYYNDSYAIREAHLLTKTSTKNEIIRVKSLPMTKDGLKQVMLIIKNTMK